MLNASHLGALALSRRAEVTRVGFHRNPRLVKVCVRS